MPYDKIKERIVLAFNKQQRDTGGTQELRIDELTSYRLTGAHATGIHLITPATEPGKPPSERRNSVISAASPGCVFHRPE